MRATAGEHWSSLSHLSLTLRFSGAIRAAREMRNRFNGFDTLRKTVETVLRPFVRHPPR